MSGSFAQALLMDDPDGVTPSVPTCTPDPYYFGPQNDPYFANVVLLHLSGADGETTISDSGPNALPFTRVGTPTISSGQQLFGGNSLRLTTTSQGYTSPANAAFQFGTGDFTVEFWVYMVALSSGDFLQFGARDASGTNRWAIDMQPNNVCGFLIDSTNFCNTNTGAIGTGAWKHIAFTRSGTTLRSFVNGVDQGNTTTVTTNFNNASTFRVGDEPAFSGFAQTYLREIRITKGVARYTTNFSTPTAAFPDAVETGSLGKTVLLLHGEGTNGSTIFTDSSTFNRTMTAAAGTPTISTAQAKFGSASVYGGTGSPQITTPTNRMEFVADDWTWETWYRRAANADYHGLAYFGNCVILLRTPINSGTYQLFITAGGVAFLASTSSVPLDTWTHLAVSVSKAGATYTVRLFFNGVLEAQTTTTSAAFSLPSGGTSLSIGRTDSAGFAGMNGYIDEYRITTGVARYTSTFTPQTLAFCESTTDPGQTPVNGTEYPAGQTLTTAQGTLRVANPWVKLTGSAATMSAGNVSVFNPNRAVALTGQALIASRGSVASPLYPNLPSSSSTRRTVDIDVAVQVTYAFLANGNITITNYLIGGGTNTVVWGTWIDTTQTAYAISSIAHLYKPRFNVISNTQAPYASVTLGATMATGTTEVSFLSTGERTQPTHSFMITVVPVPTNPRYGEPFYFGSHSFTFQFTG